MSAQGFILIPKDSYIKKQPRALDVLDEPTAVEKAKLLTILQREPERKKKLETVSKTETKPEDIKTRVLKSLSMLKPSKKEKSKSIMDKITSSDKISIDDGKVKIDDRTTAVDENTFLFDIQQSRTNRSRKDPDYKRILDRLHISPQLVENTEAKQIVKPKRPRAVLKPKSPKPVSKKVKRQDEQQPSEDSEEEEEIERGWESSRNDLRVLEQFYTKGSAAYGSIDNLQKATKLPRKK